MCPTIQVQGCAIHKVHPEGCQKAVVRHQDRWQWKLCNQLLGVLWSMQEKIHLPLNLQQISKSKLAWMAEAEGRLQPAGFS